jgi:DNA-binding MarR family transcriptional regulator
MVRLFEQGLSYASRTRPRAIMPHLIAQTPILTTGEALAPAPAFDEHAARVLRQFRLIFNTVRRHFQTMEKQSGIGGAQVWALSLVAQHQGIGVTQLADLMDIHQSTTSNLVKSLIKLGLLHSEKSVHDRRVVELYVLPDGLKLLKKIPGPFAGVLPHALHRMDEVTLLQLEDNLAALINRLEVDEKAAQTPIAMM